MEKFHIGVGDETQQRWFGSPPRARWWQIDGRQSSGEETDYAERAICIFPHTLKKDSKVCHRLTTIQRKLLRNKKKYKILHSKNTQTLIPSYPHHFHHANSPHQKKWLTTNSTAL